MIQQKHRAALLCISDGRARNVGPHMRKRLVEMGLAKRKFDPNTGAGLALTPSGQKEVDGINLELSAILVDRYIKEYKGEATLRARARPQRADGNRATDVDASHCGDRSTRRIERSGALAGGLG